MDGNNHQNLEIKHLNPETKYIIKHMEAKQAIKELKNKFGVSTLFGKEKDNSFKSFIAAINQTFGGKDLYPSIEEKAANFLYFIVINHSLLMGISGLQCDYSFGI